MITSMTPFEIELWKHVYLNGAGKNHEGRADVATEAVLEWRGLSWDDYTHSRRTALITAFVGIVRGRT